MKISKKRLITTSKQFTVVLVAFMLLEFILSFYYGEEENYYIWKPGLKYKYTLQSKYYKDLCGIVHVKINAVGAKSDEISTIHKEKIIAIGGSTTECNTVDQPFTWTEVVQENLSNAQGKQYWVGNFGKSGSESHHHILQTQELLKKQELKDANSVIYLIGFNDAIRSLRHPKRYLNTPLSDLRRRGFMVVPDKHLPYYKRFAIFKFLKYLKFNSGLNSAKG